MGGGAGALAGLRAIDIWIGESAFLGRGLGTEMMHLALQRCFADLDVSAVLVDPLANNTRAPLLRAARLSLRRTPHLWGRRVLRVYRLERRDYVSRR